MAPGNQSQLGRVTDLCLLEAGVGEMGREGQVNLEAITQTEMKSSCQEGEADKRTGRKDWMCEGLEKGIQVVRRQRLRQEPVRRSCFGR